MSGRPLYSIMAGVPVKEGTKPKLVTRSTACYTAPNGDDIIRLHRTDIIRHAGNTVILNSGGWQTVTTKDRMNSYLPGLNLWNQRGKWIIGGQNGALYEYHDGIILDTINLRPIYEKPIPPAPPKAPRLQPSDAAKWLRLLNRKPF